MTRLSFALPTPSDMSNARKAVLEARSISALHRFIRRHGPNARILNGEDGFRTTLLMAACSEGWQKGVEALLAAGADPSLTAGPAHTNRPLLSIFLAEPDRVNDASALRLMDTLLNCWRPPLITRREFQAALFASPVLGLRLLQYRLPVAEPQAADEGHAGSTLFHAWAEACSKRTGDGWSEN